MHKLTGLVISLTLTVPAGAADKDFAEARAKTIAPYLDDQAYAVVRVNVTRVKPDALWERLAEWGKLNPREVKVPWESMVFWVERFTQAGGKEVYFVFSLADINLNLPPETPFAMVPLEKGANPDLIAAALGMGIYHAEKLPGRRVVAAGSKAAL